MRHAVPGGQGGPAGSTYTALFFTETLWPDFDQAAFTQALDSFAGRQRRFGKTGEQMVAGA